MKDARNETRLADNLCVEASKFLAVVKGRNKELAIADRDRRTVEVGLGSVEVQAEEQCQRLHYIEIQQVLELKTELSKANKVAQVAHAAIDTTG